MPPIEEAADPDETDAVPGAETGGSEFGGGADDDATGGALSDPAAATFSATSFSIHSRCVLVKESSVSALPSSPDMLDTLARKNSRDGTPTLVQ